MRMFQNVRNSNVARTEKPNPGGEGGQMSTGGQSEARGKLMPQLTKWWRMSVLW